MSNGEPQYIDWLFGQLNALVEKDVISTETAQNIRAYYRERQEEARAARLRQAELHQKRVPIFMAVIAAMLVAAGAISLGAYNWYRIARGVKAALDIGLLALLQGGAFFLLLRRGRPLKTRLREGFALFYALLFGGLVAYAAQIYKLPSNPAGFFLIWTISTIFIMYAFDAAGAFVLSLALMCAYVISAKQNHAHAALFYPLWAGVLPFAASQKRGLLCVLAVYAGMLGVALEKSVPGLWIPCYCSSAALCIFYGERKGDAGIQYAGIIGLSALGMLLAAPNVFWRGAGSFWYDVGWRHFRPAQGAYFFRLYKNAIDSVVAALLIGASLAFPLVDWLRGRRSCRKIPLLPLIPSGAAALYAVCCAADGHAVGDYAQTAVLAAVLAAGAYGFWRLLRADDARWLPAVLAQLAVLFFYFLQAESSEYIYDYFSMLAAASYLFHIRKSPVEGEARGNRNYGVRQIAVLTAAVLFLFSNAGIVRADAYRHYGTVFGDGIVPFTVRGAMIFCTVLFAAAAAYTCKRFLLEKRRFNVFIAANGLFSAGIVLGTQMGALPYVPAWSGVFRFVCMMAFALYYLLGAVKTGSLFAANAAAIYLTAMILARFFNGAFSLLSKGILFIVCGALIFICNLLIAKRNKNGKSNEIMLEG